MADEGAHGGEGDGTGSTGASCTCFEDLSLGTVFSTSCLTVTGSAILDFARRYDPQPFHIDPVAARESIFGGLIASGVHVFALSIRLVCDTGVLSSNLGGNAADELRWPLPVRAGDTIRVFGEVVEAKPLASRPDRGLIRVQYTTTNGAGATVMSFRLVHFVRRRRSD
jgi:acyl dehydratase